MKTLVFLFLVVMLSTTAFGQAAIKLTLNSGQTITDSVWNSGSKNTEWNVIGYSEVVNATTFCSYNGELQYTLYLQGGQGWRYGNFTTNFPDEILSRDLLFRLYRIFSTGESLSKFELVRTVD